MIPSSCCPPYRRHETPTNPAGDRARHRALTPRHGTRSNRWRWVGGSGSIDLLRRAAREVTLLGLYARHIETLASSHGRLVTFNQVVPGSIPGAPTNIKGLAGDSSKLEPIDHRGNNRGNG